MQTWALSAAKRVGRHRRPAAALGVTHLLEPLQYGGMGGFVPLLGADERQGQGSGHVGATGVGCACTRRCGPFREARADAESLLLPCRLAAIRALHIREERVHSRIEASELRRGPASPTPRPRSAALDNCAN